MDSPKLVKLFNQIYHCDFGSLWWGRESFICERFDNWVDSGRQGHPLVSIKNAPVQQEYESIPMLVGTTGKGELTVYVTPKHPCDFSTKVASYNIFMRDFMTQDKFNGSAQWRAPIHRAYPKDQVDKKEEAALRKFVEQRKHIAYGTGRN